MQELEQFGYYATGSPMMCVRANVRTGDGTSAYIKLEIGASLLGRLAEPAGIQYLNYIAQMCVGHMAGSVVQRSGQLTLDVPLDRNLIRANLVLMGSLPKGKIKRLGEVLVLAAHQALIDGSDPHVADRGFSTNLEWYHTTWIVQREERSYFGLQLRVPRTATKQQLQTFAVPLRQHVRGEIAKAQGRHAALFIHEEGPVGDAIRVSGGTGNFNIGAADAATVELIAAAQRRAR